MPARFHRRGLSARLKKRVLFSSQPMSYHGYYRGSGWICQQAGEGFFPPGGLTAAPAHASLGLGLLLTFPIGTVTEICTSIYYESRN